MTQLNYVPKGVCSRMISVEIDGGTIESVDFVGGCDGNLKGIAKLVAGRSVDEVIGLLEGNTCGMKSTSCADQLTCALKIAREKRAREV